MITIEQIDEFRKRTNSSYEDAKYYLEKNNGEILDAIIDFERTRAGKAKNTQQKKHQEEYGRKFADILQKGFDTRIFVEDKNSVLFTIPIILLIFLIPLWVLVLLFFLFLMMLGYKFSIRDVKSQNVNVNSFFQNINDKIKDSGVNKGQCCSQNRNANPGTNPNPNQNVSHDQYQANTSQVPVPSNMTSPVATEALKPQQEADKEEGYKEFTIE